MVETATQLRHRIGQEMFPGEACSDHGCVFGHVGVGTNGGCQHLKECDSTSNRRALMKLAAIANRLAEIAVCPTPGDSK